MGPVLLVCVVSGCGKFHMAAPKAGMNREKLISQLPDQIKTRFERLYLCFRRQPNQWDIYPDRLTKLEVNRQWKSQDGDLHHEIRISQIPD